MSLYEKADGLLGTHVMWQDVESVMQKVLRTTAKFGEQRNVCDIGEMKGFMSKIALIHADWPQNSRLPDRLVVKISSELSLYGFSQLVGSSQWDTEKMEQMSPMVKECHNREVAMYRIMQRERPSCPTVNVFALESFSDENPLKAYIISEYIPNLIHVGMHQNISVRELGAVVDGIAAFSAM
uniref:Uncharacterized protein n=1 Tax=Caenorhabditis japonica TaxID=281687 RepID=A0A8R1EMH6_CAEJA